MWERYTCCPLRHSLRDQNREKSKNLCTSFLSIAMAQQVTELVEVHQPDKKGLSTSLPRTLQRPRIYVPDKPPRRLCIAYPPSQRQGQPRRNAPQTSCCAFVWPYFSEVYITGHNAPTSRNISDHPMRTPYLLNPKQPVYNP